MFSNLYLEVSNGKVVDGLNYGSSLRNETLNLNTGIKQKDTLEEDITEEDNTYYTELEADFIEEMHGMKAWIESIATKYKELYVNTQQTSNTELMEVFKALNSLDKTI